MMAKGSRAVPGSWVNYHPRAIKRLLLIWICDKIKAWNRSSRARHFKDSEERDQKTIMANSNSRCTTPSFLLKWFNKKTIMMVNFPTCKRCKNYNSSEKMSSWMPLLLYRFKISSIIVKLKEGPKTKTMMSKQELRVAEVRAFRNCLMSSCKAPTISHSLKIWTWRQITTKGLLKTHWPTRLAWQAISRPQLTPISSPRRSHSGRGQTQGTRERIQSLQRIGKFKKLIACASTEIRSMSTRKFSNLVEPKMISNKLKKSTSENWSQIRCMEIILPNSCKMKTKLPIINNLMTTKGKINRWSGASSGKTIPRMTL